MWSGQVVRRMITSGAISGQVEHLGEIISTGNWPPIIAPAQTSQLRRTLLNRPGGLPAHLAVTHLRALSYVSLWCENGWQTTRRRNARYFCAKSVDGIGCNKTTIISESLKNHCEAVLYRLDTPELQRQLITAAAQDDQAAVLQERLIYRRQR